jgi:hypothetical protein
LTSTTDEDLAGRISIVQLARLEDDRALAVELVDKITDKFIPVPQLMPRAKKSDMSFSSCCPTVAVPTVSRHIPSETAHLRGTLLAGLVRVVEQNNMLEPPVKVLNDVDWRNRPSRC